jgi:hypothetical protein
MGGRGMYSLMANFVRWGGFAPKEPLAQPVKISRSELLFGGANVDHPHMRNQLNVWQKWLSPNDVRSPVTPANPVVSIPFLLRPPHSETV